jgi:hypothetical protein
VKKFLLAGALLLAACPKSKPFMPEDMAAAVSAADAAFAAGDMNGARQALNDLYKAIVGRDWQTPGPLVHNWITVAEEDLSRFTMMWNTYSLEQARSNWARIKELMQIQTAP